MNKRGNEMKLEGERRRMARGRKSYKKGRKWACKDPREGRLMQC